jgi:hypothetical protein
MLREGARWGVLGAALAVFGWLADGELLLSRLVSRLVVCIVLGTALGVAQAHDRRERDAELIGWLVPGAWYPVHEALGTGELPEDPRFDEPIRRMVDDRLARVRRDGAWALVTLPLAVVGGIAGGLVGDDRWFVLAAAAAVVAPFRWRALSRDRERLDVLDAGLRARAQPVGGHRA